MKNNIFNFFIFVSVLFGQIVPATAQTCSCSSGCTQAAYPSGSWSGDVFLGNSSICSGSSATFTGATFKGNTTESATFNRNWSSGSPSCSGTSVNYFLVRYTMKLTGQAAGWYNFTIGADDGVRLSIQNSGVTTFTSLNYLVSRWGNNSYGTTSGIGYWAGGDMYLVLEYFQNTGGDQCSFSMCQIGTGTDYYGTFPAWTANTYYSGGSIGSPYLDPNGSNTSILAGTQAGNYDGSESSPPTTSPVPSAAGTTYSLINQNWGSGGPAVTQTSGCAPYAFYNNSYDNFEVRYKTNRTYSSSSSGLYYYTTPNNDDGAYLIVNGASVFNNYNGNNATYSGNVQIPSGSINVVYNYQQQGGNAWASLSECQYPLPSGDGGNLNVYNSSGTWNVYTYSKSANSASDGSYTSYCTCDFTGYYTAGSASTSSASFQQSDGQVASGISSNSCGNSNGSGSSNQYISAYMNQTFLPGAYTVFTGTDDQGWLYFNGTQVLNYASCCSGATGTIYISGSTNVLYKGNNNGGSGANYQVTITQQTATVGTLSSNQSCGGSSSGVTLSLSSSLGYATLYSSPDAQTWTAVGSATNSTTPSWSVSPSTTTFYKVTTVSGTSSATSNIIGVVNSSYTSGNMTIGNNVTLGGTINVSGNFTLNSGSTITEMSGCPLVINANNITISGTINGNGAGNTGGGGGSGGGDSGNGSNGGHPGTVNCGGGSGGSVGGGSGGGAAGGGGNQGNRQARGGGCNWTGTCSTNSAGAAGFNDGGSGGGGGGGGAYGGNGATGGAGAAGSWFFGGGNGTYGSDASATAGGGGSTGSTYGTSTSSSDIALGSGGGGGGGGGGGNTSGSTGGTGGTGGGAVSLIACNALTLTGTINVNGTTGGTGGGGGAKSGGGYGCAITEYSGYSCTYGECGCGGSPTTSYVTNSCFNVANYDVPGGAGGGAGGGSGGGILLEAYGAMSVSGTLTAQGGTGGPAGSPNTGNGACVFNAQGGGGGGGGRIKIVVNPCQTNSISTTNFSVSGGSGGSGNVTGNPGSAGTMGAASGSSYTAISLPTLAAGSTTTSSYSYCLGASGQPTGINANVSTGGAYNSTLTCGAAYAYQWYGAYSATTSLAGQSGNTSSPATGFTTTGLSGATGQNLTAAQISSYISASGNTTGYFSFQRMTTSGNCYAWTSTVCVTVQAYTPTPGITSSVCSGGTTISGTSSAGATIIVYDNGGSPVTVTANGSGVWTAPVLSMTSGHTMTVTAQVSGQCLSTPAASASVNSSPTAAAIAIPTSYSGSYTANCGMGPVAKVTITGGTSPYNFTVGGSAKTGQTSPYIYAAGTATSCSLTTVTDANGCPVPSGSITGSPLTISDIITAGGTSTTCPVTTVGTPVVFYDASGNLMGQVTATTGSLGNVAFYTDALDATVQITGHSTTNKQSYLQRHFHIEPTNNNTAQISLYILSSEASSLASYSSTHDNHTYYPTFNIATNASIDKYDAGGVMANETPSGYTGGHSGRTVIPFSSLTITQTPSVSSISYSNVYQLKFNISSFSGFYINAENPGDNPLPVTLLFVTANPVNNKYIQLEWATASEINNKGFEIERSTDGNDFTGIGFVAGHGTVNALESYAFDDYTAEPSTTYYYRLRQEDENGNSTYSDIVSAALIAPQGFAFTEMMPNPATDEVKLGIVSNINSNATVTMTDMLGRDILKTDLQLSIGYNASTYDLTTLPSGTYLVIISSGAIKVSKKLVIAK